MTLTGDGVERVRDALPAVLESSAHLESLMTAGSLDELNVLLGRLYAVVTARHNDRD